MTVRDTVLGVDLDEVVFRYIEGLRQVLHTSGVVPPSGEPKSYNMSEAGWFTSREEFCKAHGEAVEDGLYLKLDLIEGASEKLWDLSDSGYQITIITSRFVNPGQHQKVVSQTVEALEKSRIPYSNISFLDNKVLQFADAYIDDSPTNLQGLSEAGRLVIRKEMAYNLDSPGIRATSWSEIREILRENFGK